jgi:hypothetical protein
MPEQPLNIDQVLYLPVQGPQVGQQAVKLRTRRARVGMDSQRQVRCHQSRH